MKPNMYRPVAKPCS